MEIIARHDRTYKVYSKKEKLQLISESKTCGTALKKFCETRGISQDNQFTYAQVLRRSFK